jgi:hypothetical protein
LATIASVIMGSISGIEHITSDITRSITRVTSSPAITLDIAITAGLGCTSALVFDGA